jgi:hypothetical protein
MTTVISMPTFHLRRRTLLAAAFASASAAVGCGGGHADPSAAGDSRLTVLSPPAGTRLRLGDTAQFKVRLRGFRLIDDPSEAALRRAHEHWMSAPTALSEPASGRLKPLAAADAIPPEQLDWNQTGFLKFKTVITSPDTDEMHYVAKTKLRIDPILPEPELMIYSMPAIALVPTPMAEHHLSYCQTGVGLLLSKQVGVYAANGTFLGATGVDVALVV